MLQASFSSIVEIGRRTDFFGRPRLPHKCGVPVGVGTPHLCGSEEICLATVEI